VNAQTQCAAIQNHLLSGRALTAVEALKKFGCFRLSARILDLKHDGMRIEKIMVKRGEKRFASYRYAGAA